jgi:metal-dependent amidase/aminoacylase/carboxypeptidase family protein
VFRRAEEDASGARAMIVDGLFERFPVERIFAFLNWPVVEGAVTAHGGRRALTVAGGHVTQGLIAPSMVHAAPAHGQVALVNCARLDYPANHAGLEHR